LKTMSAGAGARAAATRVVAAVAYDGQSLDRALAEVRHPEGEHSSQGLVRLLAYETLRWYLRLDALLDRWLKPGQRIDPQIRTLALVGLCQVLHTDIPPYAAVSATVDAARLLRQPKAAGLINALLRRAQREAAAVLREIDGNHALRTSHLEWLVRRLARDWPEQWVDILDANNAHPPFWLRVNRRHRARAAYQAELAAAGLTSEAHPHAPDALRLPQAVDLSSLPGFSAGHVSVQDAAAQLCVEFLQPRPGERILDACAAPGGKACHLLERQPELRELVALDIAPERLARVRENLQRLSLRATLHVGDAAQPEQWWDGAAFDRVLLDVPCSATGVIRRHPDIKLLRRESDIAALAERQRALLAAAWRVLKPGGVLLYASCSAFRAENAEVVNAFLQHTRATDLTPQRAAELGLRTQSGSGYAIAAGTAGMDGFYYACLQKPDGTAN
jgi:16S rRNA (cytosine967-C5)-methyltransferase